MAQPIPSGLVTRTQGSEAETSAQWWAELVCPQVWVPRLTGRAFFPHRSRRKAMQTQQNKHTLPTPPVAFYRKISKAVASGIIDSPWIPTTSETQGAETFCRNKNRCTYTRRDASWVGTSLYKFASMVWISVEWKWIYLAQLLDSVCLFIYLHLFPSFMLLRYFHFH